MSTTQQTWTGTRGIPTPHVDTRSTTCSCGQDLDLVTSGHCPRCGTQLGQARFEAVGFWYAA